MKTKISAVNFYIISFLYFVVALHLFLDRQRDSYLIENILLQIIILLSLSFFISIIYLKQSKPSIIIVLVIIDTIFSLLIIRLNINTIGPRLWISTLIFFKYSIRFPVKKSFIFSLSIYFLLLFLQMQDTVFGLTFTKLPDEELFFLFLTQCIFLFICNISQLVIIRLEKNKFAIIDKDKYITSLISANIKYQDFALNIEKKSKLDERLRITREIHDITGYTLTSLIMMLEYADDLLKDEQIKELFDLLNTAKEHARKGHNEIRSSLKDLRSIEESKISFFNRIYNIINNFMVIKGVDITLEFTNLSLRFNKNSELFICRFIQEGLTNAFRHGNATKITIIFFQETDNIMISIEDNGNGGTNISEGIGLNGINERIEERNGELRYFASKKRF